MSLDRIRIKFAFGIEHIKLLFFTIYNIFYALYMSGFLSRTIYLFTLVLFIVICILQYITQNKDRIKFEYKKETLAFLMFFGFVLLYSFCIQLINKNIKTYLISSSAYLILPFVTGYFWIISTPSKYRTAYFYVYFIRCCMVFLMNIQGNFSLDDIFKIDINDSNSSIYESSEAHNFLILELIFLYKKKKILPIICALFCVLSFKRLSFILSIVLLFAYRFIPRKKCNKRLIYISTVLLIIVPYFYGWLISANGQQTFYNLFKIQLDDFMTGRISFINKSLNSIGKINGYGSISYMINIGNTNIGKYSLHCDLYQLYLECTIISVAIFSWYIFKLGSKNYYSLFLVLYFVLELIISQFFINLSAWTLLYMFIFYSDKEGN